MPRKWTDLDLKRIGWQEAEWPAIDALELKGSTPAWQALRRFLADVRENMAAFDNAAAGLDGDRTLTELGKIEKMRAGAKLAIGNCESANTLTELEGQVTRCVDGLRAKMSGLPAMPEDPVTAMMYAEIRAHLASEPKDKRVALARSLLKDQRVCGAVFNGPAFLSGLSEDDHTLLRTEAEHILHPVERRTVDQLTGALEAARAAARSAANKVAERVNLAKAADGTWVLTSRPAVTQPMPVLPHQPSVAA